MKRWPEAIGITHGKDAWLIAEDGTQYIDAISSWWVNLHGHAHPHIAAAIGKQAATLEHCIFAGFTHEPAVTLAERLIKILPGNMGRIFYSDNGSTAVEVALKMAWQYWQNKGKAKTKLLSLEGAYHGDTVGAMSVSARSTFTDAFNPWLFDVGFLPFPSAGNENACLDALEQQLKTDNVAAVILEPLIQGSAGMYMYTPETLEAIVQLCRRYETLVIADEVMTGFGRTGKLFAFNHIDATPDMICLSKGLTGGTMPLGVTACTADIFEAFYSDDLYKTLYHGHSFTANPLACAAANASMDLLLDEACTNAIAHIAARHEAMHAQWNGHPKVKEIRRCGTIIALELDAGETHYHNGLRDFIYRFFIERKLLMRPLGNIIYILPPYCITDEQLDIIYQHINELLEHI
jgi:adenosylmethionine-8-amino-7-oxononanoate aminotransferase